MPQNDPDPRPGGANVLRRNLKWLLLYPTVIAVCGAAGRCAPTHIDLVSLFEVFVLLDVGLGFVLLRYCWDYPAAMVQCMSKDEAVRLQEKLLSCEKMIKRWIYAYIVLSLAMWISVGRYPIFAGMVWGIMVVSPFHMMDMYKDLAVFRVKMAKRAYERDERAIVRKATKMDTAQDDGPVQAE